MKNNTVELDFFGQKLIFKASGDTETNQEVIALVAQKLKQATERAQTLSPHQVAILALLDLAEDYVHTKRKTKKFKFSLDQKTKELMSLVDFKTIQS
ncbi:MAG: cell division protein ZapA [Deltaproteobacteria bacterium]|nr:cell division protein ZapA [Deltaproteobacteria bacterium]MBI4925525.1 cell division protein ZapA [Bdellovibrio sp.]